MPSKERQRLEQLANDPKSFLSNMKGLFSLVKTKDYDLFECLCSEKLDRAHPEYDMREFIDAQLSQALDPLSKDEPVHMLDIGAGMLFSSAVRVAKLVNQGFKDVHIYLVDPIYDDNSTDTKRSAVAQKSFQEFSRLMQDCGIHTVLGEAQGNTKKITDALGGRGSHESGEKDEARVHIHTFGELRQIPTKCMQDMDAVVIVDFFPPIPINTILGDQKKHLADKALIFSCKEKFLSPAEMLNSLDKKDMLALNPNMNATRMNQIKMHWDKIVKEYYPKNPEEDFDPFYSIMFSKSLPPDTAAVFEDALRRISKEALQVSVSSKSQLQAQTTMDTEYHALHASEELMQSYSENPFTLWERASSNPPSDSKAKQAEAQVKHEETKKI